MQHPGRLLLPLALLTACGGPDPAPQPTSRPTSRPAADPVALRLERTAAIHGAAGPFAVAGHRIGERALAELGAERGRFAVDVVHRTPPEVQWSCVADGLQAATGASPGKLNLTIVEVAGPDATESVVTHRESGRVFRARLAEAFVARYLDTPMEHVPRAGREVAALPEEEVFTWEIEGP